MNIEISPSEARSLHEMFLTPGFEFLNKMLGDQLNAVFRSAIEQSSTPDEDIQILNNLRGCNDVIQTIRDIRDEVSRRVNENNQQFLWDQRDNHTHPWIAEGITGKETFLGGV